MNFSEKENTVLRKEKKKKPRFFPELKASQWKKVPWTQFLTSVA